MTETKYGVAVGYDGSEFSERALDWAVEEARLRGTKLTICHFWQFPYTAFAAAVTASVQEPPAELMERAISRAHAAAPDVPIATVVESGSPARALIDLSPDADLVVVGTHGLSGLRQLMLGSVSAQVAAHSTGRVVVVRGDQAPDSGQIVAGFDGSPAADLALALAFEEAELRGLPLLALHAQPDGKDAGAPTEAGFHAAVDRLRQLHPEVKAEASLTDQPVVESLLAAANSATLLVLGSRGLGTVKGRLLGSVSQSLLHQAPCPVAVVHSADSDT